VNWIFETSPLILEILAVLFGICYVIFAAQNKLIAWPFGIISSLISIYIFWIYANLYAEAVLYSYYVFAGIYGWFQWDKLQKNSSNKGIVNHNLIIHIYIIIIGIVLSIGLYYLLIKLTKEAARPLIDSFTTIFSFIATYMTAKKWIENWLYWILINIVSVYLYFSRGLEIYALLMLLNAIIAAFAYFKWKKIIGKK
jgi:nicotinamide mononucleotide transporter